MMPQTAHDAPNRAEVPKQALQSDAGVLASLVRCRTAMRKVPISMSATWPPDGRLGWCHNPEPLSADGEQPPIIVGAQVNGSGPTRHAEFTHLLYSSAPD